MAESSNLDGNPRPCGYEAGRRCVYAAVGESIFCDRHQHEPCYMGLVLANGLAAIAASMVLRRENFNANVWREKFVVIGPVKEGIITLDAFSGKVYRAHQYETLLAKMIEGEGVSVPNYSEPTPHHEEGHAYMTEVEYEKNRKCANCKTQDDLVGINQGGPLIGSKLCRKCLRTLATYFQALLEGAKA